MIKPKQETPCGFDSEMKTDIKKDIFKKLISFAGFLIVALVLFYFNTQSSLTIQASQLIRLEQQIQTKANQDKVNDIGSRLDRMETKIDKLIDYQIQGAK